MYASERTFKESCVCANSVVFVETKSSITGFDSRGHVDDSYFRPV